MSLGIDPLMPTFEIPKDEGPDKRMSLKDAVHRFILPGDSVPVAYSDARPNAALLQMVRQFAATLPALTLSTPGLGSVQHALM